MSVSFTYFIVGKVGEMLGAGVLGRREDGAMAWLLVDGFTASSKGGLAFNRVGEAAEI